MKGGDPYLEPFQEEIRDKEESWSSSSEVEEAEDEEFEG
jgi:hypothetical protein